MVTDDIVTFVVVTVTETGSSSRMEVKGFWLCILQLFDKGFAVEVVATNILVQIKSVTKNPCRPSI